MRFYVVVLLLCFAVFLTFPATKLVSCLKNTPARKPMSRFSCLAGHPGIPGLHGNTGAPGQDGRDGREGIPWKRVNEVLKGLTALQVSRDPPDHGVVQDCVFNKNFSDTFLHVYWNGNFRIHSCDTCCKRWFFTFNGAECQTPRAIDGILYMWKGAGTQNIHRVRHIEGHCDKIHKGQVRVGFNVGNCAGYGNADVQTGWNSASRLFVEEVPRPQS